MISYCASLHQIPVSIHLSYISTQTIFNMFTDNIYICLLRKHAIAYNRYIENHDPFVSSALICALIV